MNYSEQQKKAYNELKKRLVAYMSSVQSIYDNISAQAADIALKTDYDPESNEVFSFSDYPEQRTAIQKMQNDFVTDLSNLIDRGITKEWQMSNEAQNLLINSMVESAGVRLNNFYQKKFWQYNDEALNAFKKRKDKGMSLSTKIWQQSSELKTQLEDTISVAIQRGMSAVTLSKRISQYLQNYQKLKQDYGEKFGTAIRCRDCEYKSIRLARTEINMSYRMAEQERWQNLDFVLGYRIKLSKNHTCKGVINFYDICDELEGVYPKYIKWAGWHPSCRCYAIPILMSEAEFERYNRGEETTEKPITEMPKQFYEWLANNADRIEKAQERGTLPYFLRDNKQLILFVENRDLISKSNFDTILHDSKIFGVDVSPLYKELNNREATTYSVMSVAVELYDATRNSQLRLAYESAYDRYKKAIFKFRTPEDFKAIDYDFSNITTREELENKIKLLNRKASIFEKALIRQSQRSEYAIEGIVRSWNETRISQAFGITKGSPMSFAEANEMKVNPYYYLGGSYTINCQTCTPVYALRKQGWNIRALGNTPGSMLEDLSTRPHHAFLTPKGEIPKPTSIVYKNEYDLLSGIESTFKEKGLYSVTCRWDTGNGHSFTFERLSNGKLRFYDGQNGRIIDLFDYARYIAKGSDVNILRIDNLIPNNKYITKIAVPSTSKSYGALQQSKNTIIGRPRVTPEIKQAQKELREILKTSKDDKELTNLSTGKLITNRVSKENFTDHVYSLEEKEACKFIWNNPDKLQYVRQSTFGEGKDMTSEKAIKNLSNKESRGVKWYNSYSFEYNGKTYYVKLEQVEKNGVMKEQFYSLTLRP